MSDKKKPVEPVDLSDMLDEPPALAGAKLSTFAPEMIGPPLGTVLFWAEYTCACGRKSDGPVLDSPVLVKHQLLKHKCFGKYIPNGMIYRPATAETQYLPAEVHWESRSIPKCLHCASTAIIPDMHQIDDPQLRFSQMHETASVEHMREYKERSLQASLRSDADERELNRWLKQQL